MALPILERVEKSKPLKYGIGLMMILAMISILMWSRINTFDGKGYRIQAFFGFPVTAATFLFLHYRRWKRKPHRENPALFILTAFLVAVSGLVVSFIFVVASELTNAAWSSGTVEDEVIVLSKGGSKRSLRSPETFTAHFSSRMGNGDFSINANEAARLAINGVYRIRYNVGLFGWKYQIGPLDIMELKDAHLSSQNGEMGVDSLSLRLLKRDSILKGMLQRKAGE